MFVFLLGCLKTQELISTLVLVGFITVLLAETRLLIVWRALLAAIVRKELPVRLLVLRDTIVLRTLGFLITSLVL